jgi:SNF2 family DNA or RNA helicase
MLRDYQKKLAQRAYEIISKLMIVYLAFEMRVGKTLTALQTAQLYGAKHVLFVTKKKAIESIKGDYQKGGFDFELTVVNFESLHKVVSPDDFDFIVTDEGHSLGAYPKPAKRTKLLKLIAEHKPIVYLSGTPSPESYSQLYHQFYVSSYSPFGKFKNFYQFAREFVNIKRLELKTGPVNDYSHAKVDLMKTIIEPYFLTYTQEQAGFEQAEIQEEVITVKMHPHLSLLRKVFLRDDIYKFRDGTVIVGDTPAKKMGKIHQLSSGTVITEEGKLKVLDDSKARFIKENYSGKKIAIFYKYKAEGEMLKSLFENVTESPEEFQSSDKVFISQIQSGAMGTNLSSADVLLFFNIDYSATMYWQARARLQTFERSKIPVVHFLFSEDGIEKNILKTVKNKLDYTSKYFKKDFLGVN